MIEIPIPYNLKQDQLVLEARPASSVDESLEWMRGMDDDAIERVFRGAMCLFAVKAGPFYKCLDTALIWECG